MISNILFQLEKLCTINTFNQYIWAIVEIDVAYEEVNEDCGEDDEDELHQMGDVVTEDANDVEDGVLLGVHYLLVVID